MPPPGTNAPFPRGYCSSPPVATSTKGTIALDSGRYEVLASAPLPEEIKQAFASPPELDAPAPRRWGEFVDAAVAAELEMVSYGERPPLLHELRAGLEQAAAEAGPLTEKGRWFLARRDALPGTDLPDDPGYLPI